MVSIRKVQRGKPRPTKFVIILILIISRLISFLSRIFRPYLQPGWEYQARIIQQIPLSSVATVSCTIQRWRNPGPAGVSITSTIFSSSTEASTSSISPESGPGILVFTLFQCRAYASLYASLWTVKFQTSLIESFLTFGFYLMIKLVNGRQGSPEELMTSASSYPPSAK